MTDHHTAAPVSDSRPDDGSADSDPMAVGKRIRQFRKEAGLSLRKLAQLSELSVGFLSQVERGLSSIALSSLHAVATALDRPIADFFATAPGDVPVREETVFFTLNRAAERPRRVVSGGRQYELLSARAPGLVLEPLMVYIAPGGAREPAAGHAGEEFAYILEGELLYEVDGEEYRLGPGDSLHLRSDTPHRFYNDGDDVTVVVSVVTPRHF